MTSLRSLALAAFVLASCAGDPEGTISITTGEETDALSRAPAPASLVAEALALDRSRRELARATLPTDSFSLGTLPRSDVGAIAVTALDAAGKPILRGETLYVQWGALESAGLEVFVQRTGELARVPRGPASIDVAHAAVAVGRYLLATDGIATTLYDLLNLRALESPPSFPRPARSLVTFDATALLIDDQGATAFDLQTRREGDVAAPAGASFAEIAGGSTVRATEGTQLVVGATRLAGGPTPRVLHLAADGKLTAVSLANSREGACATWVEGRGLVVYGGSEAAPGGEVVAPGATQAAALPFPPDPIRGCGAATLDGSHVLVVGDEARVLDLGCASDCNPVVWPGALGLVRADAFPLAPDAALVLGDDATGASRAFRVTAGGHVEIPLKTPRRGARLVPLPQHGLVMIAGGGPGLEQYAE